MVDAFGARVEQYYALEQDVPVSGEWGDGEATIWAEQLGSVTPAHPPCSRMARAMDGSTISRAVISASYGKGTMTDIGALLDDKLMASAVG
jgi:beta-galactosidase